MRKLPYIYPKGIREFAKVRMEQTRNNTQIAREIKDRFDVPLELERIRKFISRLRISLGVNAEKLPIKRLFFDIETGYYILNIRTFSLRNRTKFFNHKDIVKEKEILCISYKWQFEDTVYTIDNSIGEKQMLKKFIKILGEADEAVAHNGDRFDIKFLRTRCLKHSVLMFPSYRTLDTYKKSKSHFDFASHSLDYIATFLNVGSKKEHEGFEMWEKIVEGGDKDALKKMIEYCEQDVIILEDSYHVMSPYISHNNNFAVLKHGEKWHCPECTSNDVKMYDSYATPLGVIRRKMKCKNCNKQYPVSNVTYLNYLDFVLNGEKDEKA